MGNSIHNYFDLLQSVNPYKVALIEDDTAYTYGELVKLACDMAAKVKRNCAYKKVHIIQEKNILNQLIQFFACNAAGIIPVIVPFDIKLMPDIGNVPENACMAVMTSGTTGIPKLLYRTYKSWADFFPVQNKIFGINEKSILFAQGSLAFTGNMNLYMAQFYVGGTVVAQNEFNPKRWAYVIEKENVNAVYLIPSKLKLLPDIFKEPISSVKSVLSGSQSFGRDDADKLKKIFPMADIILYYGASELSYITYVKDKDMVSDNSFVGKPFPGTEIFIRDGKIYASNNCQAEGIKCPYPLPDNGHMDMQGNLYFDGRSDDTVIIHGRKVSLVRIENELEKLEEVYEAAAVFVKKNNKEIIVAFISVSWKFKDKNVILNKLRKSLAHYEMPSKIVVLDKMVYNESGKKDKNKILALYKNSILKDR